MVRVRTLGGSWTTMMDLKGAVDFNDPTAGNTNAR